MDFFGEATYWHNHPDLPRLAQNMREQLEQQRMTRLTAYPADRVRRPYLSPSAVAQQFR